jgi:1L-myo-inositol 1-phosphate cytidylyltransferase
MGGDGKRKSERVMDCLIIAAGQGTRLRSRAPSKPLAQVCGAPLIEHIIGMAASGGASRFTVVTGYEAEGIESFLAGLGARSGLPIETVRNPEWARPNGISVLAAAPRLRSDFILLMSDHLFDPAMLRGLLGARRSDAALTLACDRRIERPELDLDDATKVKLGSEGRIAQIGKALTDYDAVDTGIFVAAPALFGALEESIATGGAGSLSEGVQRLAEAGSAFTHDTGDGWWLDVDDEPAFLRAERELPDRLAAISPPASPHLDRK